MAALATVAANRPELGVVWVDSATTVVSVLVGAVVCADVLRVVKSVDLVTMVTPTVEKVVVVLGGWRS